MAARNKHQKFRSGGGLNRSCRGNSPICRTSSATSGTTSVKISKTIEVCVFERYQNDVFLIVLRANVNDASGGH